MPLLEVDQEEDSDLSYDDSFLADLPAGATEQDYTCGNTTVESNLPSLFDEA